MVADDFQSRQPDRVAGVEAAGPAFGTEGLGEDAAAGGFCALPDGAAMGIQWVINDKESDDDRKAEEERDHAAPRAFHDLRKAVITQEEQQRGGRDDERKVAVHGPGNDQCCCVQNEADGRRDGQPSSPRDEENSRPHEKTKDEEVAKMARVAKAHGGNEVAPVAEHLAHDDVA